jgi:hypothetical protein
VAASPAERKMMEELAKMQEMMDKLTKENKNLKARQGEGGGGGGEELEKMKAMLEAKQKELQDVLNAEGTNTEAATAAAAQFLRQKEDYARRGITLVNDGKENRQPYFINLDEDGFRDKRFMFIFIKPSTTIGPEGDINNPLSFSIVKNHCVVAVGADGTVTLPSYDMKRLHVNKCQYEKAYHIFDYLE